MIACIVFQTWFFLRLVEWFSWMTVLNEKMESKGNEEQKIMIDSSLVHFRITRWKENRFIIIDTFSLEGFYLVLSAFRLLSFHSNHHEHFYAAWIFNWQSVDSLRRFRKIAEILRCVNCWKKLLFFCDNKCLRFVNIAWD